MKLTIIIPCYNEEESIEEVLRQIQEIELPVEREVIVVDDGSTDNSVEIIRKFNGVKLLEHKVNMGKGAAIRTGVENSTGDLVVIQDADLEYDPRDIPSLIHPILKGQADVVLGSRFKEDVKDMSLTHRIGNRILSTTASMILGMEITDMMTGYKAFTMEAYRKLTIDSNGFEVEPELVAKFANKGLRIVEVPIKYKRRSFGRSKITLKHGFLSLKTILKYGMTDKLYAFAIFIMCFIYYVIFNLNNFLIGFKGKTGATLLNGDEPHYLIVIKSIIEDFDFNLENNYLNSPWKINEWHAIRGINGFYSAHGIGLPIMLSPFYLLGGLLLVQIFLSALSAALVAYIFKSCLEMTSDRKSAILTSLIFGLASLIVPFSNQIFPEIPMALILILSTYYIAMKRNTDPTTLLILGVLIGFAPMLKSPYVIFIVPFFINVAWLSYREHRISSLISYLTPILILGSALMLYQYLAFGDPLRTPQPFIAGNIVNGILGLMLDRYYGLFTYTPVAILSMLGIAEYYRRSRTAFAVTTSSFLGLYLTASYWIDWNGGWSYPARLIMPVIPLMALPTAFAIRRFIEKLWFRSFLLLTTTLSFIINFSITWIRGLGVGKGISKQKVFNYFFAWFTKNLHIDISALFPDFNEPLLTSNWVWIICLLGVSFIVITAQIKWTRKSCD